MTTLLVEDVQFISRGRDDHLMTARLDAGLHLHHVTVMRRGQERLWPTFKRSLRSAFHRSAR